MISGASTPGTNWFLNGLENVKAREAVTQRQISSGYRIESAADSPSQISDLVGLTSNLSTNEVSQQNFTRLKSELDAVDQSFSSTISIVDSARSLGLQAANSFATPAVRQSIAAQVQGLLQQVVSISNTSVEGRYIFSGDTTNVIPFKTDTTTPVGFSYQGSATATRQVADLNGGIIYSGSVGSQIFDRRDSLGVPTADNLLTGLQNLADAITNNTGIPDAVTALQTASAYLNQQQTGVGASLQRLTAAQSQAGTQSTRLKTSISGIRDTDITQAAIDLNTEKVAESASLAAQGGVSRKSLFDYIG